MLGRQNNNIIVRLLKINENPLYHIIITRKRSKATSRLDLIGYVGQKKNYTFLKIDFTKLTKYLCTKNIHFSKAVLNLLNLDCIHIKYLKIPGAYTKKKNHVN